jgi:hypothetical protein
MAEQPMTLKCGHPEDKSQRRAFPEFGRRRGQYTHRVCVDGHVDHWSNPGVAMPKTEGWRRAPRLEDQCPVCRSRRRNP